MEAPNEDWDEIIAIFLNLKLSIIQKFIIRQPMGKKLVQLIF